MISLHDAGKRTTPDFILLMANYYATARSNYFTVKDVEAFKKWAEELCLTVHEERRDENSKEPRRFAIFADNGDSNGWPGYNYETDEEVDIFTALAPHLADGEVAVLMEAGAEKLRYVTGYAVAIHSSGKTKEISLNGIYALAAEEFGVDQASISRCEY